MQIENLHRFNSQYYGKSGYAAEVVTDAGDRLIVSRYDDESRWVADGLYPASRDWFPVYWNGEGSRCTRLRVPNAEVQQALDVSAERR